MRNIQIIATEMYKRINNLSPPIMNRVFKLNSDSLKTLDKLETNFTIFQNLGKIGISRDREYFLPWPKNLRYTT